MYFKVTKEYNQYSKLLLANKDNFVGLMKVIFSVGWV